MCLNTARGPFKFREQPQNRIDDINHTFKSKASRIHFFAYNMPAPTYLISKVADPIFAVFIGLGAAATRINREEKEIGHSTQQTIDVGLRCVSRFSFRIDQV